MTTVDLIILGAIVGSNNFAVALSLGALNQASRRYRVMFVFGVFEFLLPLVGIYLGSTLAMSIGIYSSLVGAALLFGLGLLTATGGFRKGYDDELLARRLTQWKGLLVLAAGLSLDNLLVGFGLGLGEVQPLIVAGAISFFSVIYTWLGIQIGQVSRRRWEHAAKIFTGVLLMLLGIATAQGWL